jgi:hypothetical protein
MSKYKINIDKPSPSKKETQDFKNFDSLQKDFVTIHKPTEFHKKLFKDKKLIRFVILLLAVLLAVFFGKNANDEQTEQEEQPDIYFESPSHSNSNSSD